MSFPSLSLSLPLFGKQERQTEAGTWKRKSPATTGLFVICCF
jgi:hypothetical protein